MRNLLIGMAFFGLLPLSVHAKDICLRMDTYSVYPDTRPDAVLFLKFKAVGVPLNGAENLVGISYWGTEWGEKNAGTGYLKGIALGMTDGSITYQLDAKSWDEGVMRRINVTNANRKTFIGTIDNHTSNTNQETFFINCAEYPKPILAPVVP